MTTTNEKTRVPKRKARAKDPAVEPKAATADAAAIAGAGTLQAMSERYIKSLEAAGKSHGTQFSYGMELKLALKALGGETKVADLTVTEVEAFFASDLVTKTRTGKPKAKPTIDKTRRVLRLALEWAVSEGWMKEAPLPKNEEAKA
ncbi:MAG: hypothetical protein H6807_15165 [Planctomycetes bacterium]|nr:hypothetical protein [Planctomycetota bacterium]